MELKITPQKKILEEVDRLTFPLEMSVQTASLGLMQQNPRYKLNVGE